MAKSIWKPLVKISRQEKKRLRKVIPHPNKGRAYYQWLVKARRIGAHLASLDNTPPLTLLLQCSRNYD